MGVLIEEVRKYEVDTQEEAAKLIDEAISNSKGDLSFTRTARSKKEDSWFEVKIVEKYPDMKR